MRRAPHRRHIIGGVEFSLELCAAGGAGGLASMLSKMGFGSISRSSSSEVAAAFVNERIRKALEAAHVAAQVVNALQVGGRARLAARRFLLLACGLRVVLALRMRV